jgi:hypothetical protein
MGKSGFGKVTRAELRGFDAEATELILWAQMRGATVKISKRTHAILRGPNGATASVPRNMYAANRTAKNTRAQVRRMFREG